MFSGPPLLILKICGAVIVVGLILLGIDRFVVRPNEPTHDDLLSAAAAELEMTLQREAADADRILAISRALGDLVPPAERIGAALVRADDAHELIVYEHLYDARALRTRTQSHEMEVELLGILIRLPGVDLPRFGLRPDGTRATEEPEAAREIVTPEAIERMGSFRDFVLAAEGEHLLFLSEPPSSALVAATQRRTSPEFQPGLGNSGLKIDVQRALDITNLLALGRDPLPAVYRIDTGDIDVDVEVPELDLGLDRHVEETHREIDAIMERHRKQSEERRAKFEADMKAARERMRGNLSGEGADAEVEDPGPGGKGSDGESDTTTTGDAPAAEPPPEAP